MFWFGGEFEPQWQKRARLTGGTGRGATHSATERERGLTHSRTPCFGAPPEVALPEDDSLILAVAGGARVHPASVRLNTTRKFVPGKAYVGAEAVEYDKYVEYMDFVEYLRLKARARACP